MSRTGASYIYAGLMAVLLVAVNLWVWPYDRTHPDSVVTVLYLGTAAAAMNLTSASVERGRITLAGLVVGAAVIVVNPLNATLVGIASQCLQPRPGTWRIAWNVGFSAVGACVGALVATHFHDPGPLSIGPRLLVIATVNGINLVLVVIGFRLRTADSLLTIIRHSFSPSLFAAFGYFALGALLISYVLDGSLLGYVLSTIVCILALALTDTVAGRRVRRSLESELSDADRHLFHSRAVEGVVHNLRNHMANALGYLREIDSRRLDPVDRESLETATAAANDAVAVLRSLSQGATPRVTYATEPVDLNELVTRAMGMARPRARTKEVQLAVRETPDPVKVRADPLLLREVITNLINNAIDAAHVGGRVEATTGRRANGWPYLSIADNGPGVSDHHRHRLFEPHFTTKEGGTGLGLFMSYGIVREHQGQLIYEGSRRGAVFTVTLPPFTG